MLAMRVAVILYVIYITSNQSRLAAMIRTQILHIFAQTVTEKHIVG
jgi:hypothetical protein